MKDYTFLIVFTNHNNITINASNVVDAIILAKAKMINKGLSHNVDFVKNDKNKVIKRGN